MNAVAQLSAGISGLIFIVVFPFEAFFIHRPEVQRFLGIEQHDIRNVHLWSFSVGTRNALAGVGTLIGLGMVNFGDESAGVTVVVVTCAYMLLTSLSMGLSDALGIWRPRGGSIKGTVSAAILPAVALIAIAVG